MKRRDFRALLPTLLASVLVGCFSSPTQESAPGTLLVSGSIASASGEATLVRFDCYLDGVAMRSPLGSSGTARASETFSVNVDKGLGWHHLDIRIVAQTHAPTTYRFTNLKVEHWSEVGWGTPRFDTSATLPDRTVELDTGAAASWDFML